MIALDTNILVRYLVCDDLGQAEAAREVLESLSVDSPGYVCREVTVELSGFWNGPTTFLVIKLRQL